MKVFLKTMLAILFAIGLIQIMILVANNTAWKISDFALISISGSAASLYYFIFERKSRKKS